MALKALLSRAQRVGFFKMSGGFGSGFEKKRWVAGGLESGRSVEILDWVFPHTIFTLKYFRLSRVFPGI